MDARSHDIPDDLMAFESSLSRLVPASKRLSADRLMFEAGVRSARSSRGARVLPWAIAACSLAVAVGSSSVYVSQREQSRELSALVASQAKRLDSLESRTDAIATTVETLPSSPNGYLRMRARWISDGYSAPEPRDVQNDKPVRAQQPPPSTPALPRRRMPVDL